MLGHNLGIQQFNLRMKRRNVQPATHHRLAEGGETDTGIEDLLAIRQIAADHRSENGKAVVNIERNKEIPLGIINIRGAAKCIRHLLLFDTNLFYLFRSEHKLCGIPLLFAQQRRVTKKYLITKNQMQSYEKNPTSANFHAQKSSFLSKTPFFTYHYQPKEKEKEVKNVEWDGANTLPSTFID